MGAPINGTMSPSLLPRAEPLVLSISVLAWIRAMPPLTCSRLMRAMPAGLPNTVLASSADDERPAKAVPMLLTLCSLMAKPLAKPWLAAEARARDRQVLTTLLVTEDS